MRRILTDATAAFTDLAVFLHDRGEGLMPQEESGGMRSPGAVAELRESVR